MVQDKNPETGPRSKTEISAIITRTREALEAMSASPLRLRELDRRQQDLSDIEAALELTDEEQEQLSVSLLCEYIGVCGLRREQIWRLREAYSDDSVIADAWEQAVTEYRSRFADPHPPKGEVMVVLQGEPDWDVTDVLLSHVTAAPIVGPASRRRWRFSLLRCPEWFYWLLRSEISEVTPSDRIPRLGAPVPVTEPQEAETITALWDEDPNALYFDLREVATAVRALLR